MDLNMDRLHSQLIIEEGLRLLAYDDATSMPVKPGQPYRGRLTIGVGRNLDGNPLTGQEYRFIGHDARALPITHAQAIYLLDHDIATAHAALDDNIPWWSSLDEIRARVLVDMCFNMAIHKLLGFPHFLTALRDGDHDEAGNELENSLWYKQVGQRGERLADMIRTGEDWTA